MDKITHCINHNRFIPIDTEELTALELIGKTVEKTNEVVEKSNNHEGRITENENKKVSFDDMKNKYKFDNDFNDINYTGKWFGLEKPTLSNEGMMSQVEKNASDIKMHSEQLDSIENKQYIYIEDFLEDTNGDYNQSLTLASQKAIDEKRTVKFLGKGYNFNVPLLPSCNYIGEGMMKTILRFTLPSGEILRCNSYYSNPQILENFTIISLGTAKINGIVVNYNDSWGGCINLRNINIVGVKGTTLELFNAYQCHIENCLFEGSWETRQGIAIKFYGETTFGNCNLFTNSTFHMYHIIIYQRYSTQLIFNRCTFENSNLLINILQEKDVTSTVKFESCWFENLSNGVLNAEIDLDTLAIKQPIAKYCPLGNIIANNGFISGQVRNHASEIIDPTLFNKFSVAHGLNDNYRTTVRKALQTKTFTTSTTVVENTINIDMSELNVPLSSRELTGFSKYEYLVSVTGKDGNLITAIYSTTNLKTPILIQGEINDPFSLLSDYKVKCSWGTGQNISFTVKGANVTAINVYCLMS